MKGTQVVQARESVVDQIHAEVSLIAGRLNLAHAELVEATQRRIDGEL